MTKGIFSLKILIFSILSIFLLYPSGTFAEEQCDDLFIYEKQILIEISKKKEITSQNELLKISEIKNSTPTFVDSYFAKQIFNKFEKEIKEYKLIEEVSSYVYTETNLISRKTIEEYIPSLKIANKEPNSSLFIATLLEYIEPISQERSPKIPMEYIDTLFAEESETSEPDYSYFLELRAKPEIAEIEIYASDFKTSEIENTPPSNQPSGSTDVNFVLTILPVRFVYVENNEIIKIWNNVKKDDTQYVVKFVDQNEKEITPTEKLYSQYFSIIEDLDVFEHGTIYDEDTRISKKISTDKIHIQVNENPFEKEEIYTMI